MKGEIINPQARVKIDIFKLESGTQIIAAYVDPNTVQDTTFENILRRVAFE